MHIHRYVSSLVVLMALAANANAAGFRFVDGDGYRELLLGDQPIYRYMTKWDPADSENTYKPFHHLYGLHGEGYITKGPGGFETHHRGLFLGFTTPAGNFWSSKDVHQEHVKYLKDREQVGPDLARDASVTDWIDKDGKTIIRDTREVTARRTAPDQVLLDFDITIESQGGDVALSGNAHHAGFHFRAADEVAGDGKSTKAGLATYIRPAGATLIKDDEWSQCPWSAMAFTVKGHPYLLMHMNYPDNPGPVTYSTRPYGRAGAFFLTTLHEKQPVKLRYRILLFDGEKYKDATPETLNKFYTDFVTAK